jgi:hypothetical protein
MFRKSSRCASTACVEVDLTGTTVLARHSKNPDGSVLEFTPDEWRAFIAAAKAGEFDLPLAADVAPQKD